MNQPPLPHASSLFRGRHFDRTVIILCVQTKVWTSKYLNNIVGQDHRRVKQRIYPLLGFKRFGNAAVTISGIELAQQIRERQFDAVKLRCGVEVRVTQVWEAVLAD